MKVWPVNGKRKKKRKKVYRNNFNFLQKKPYICTITSLLNLYEIQALFFFNIKKQKRKEKKKATMDRQGFTTTFTNSFRAST